MLLTVGIARIGLEWLGAQDLGLMWTGPYSTLGCCTSGVKNLRGFMGMVSRLCLGTLANGQYSGSCLVWSQWRGSLPLLASQFPCMPCGSQTWLSNLCNNKQIKWNLTPSILHYIPSHQEHSPYGKGSSTSRLSNVMSTWALMESISYCIRAYFSFIQHFVFLKPKNSVHLGG